MQKRCLLNFLWPLLAIAIVCFSKPLVKRVTGGFQVHKILTHFPSDPRWAAEPLIPREEIREILSQKFSYFGKGRQCYAFLSEDGEYVIKFFNQIHHVESSPRTRHRDLLSNYTSFCELKEESGLLMIHFCSEVPMNQSITLVDGCHIAHTIDLDKVEFLLQRRMKLPFDVIRHAMKHDKEAEAKAALDNIFTFIHARLERGLLDFDPKLYTNYGFIDGKVYQLDSGQITRASSIDDYLKDRKHFRIRNRRTQRWFEQNYPTLLPYYLSHIDSLEQHYQQYIPEDEI